MLLRLNKQLMQMHYKAQTNYQTKQSVLKNISDALNTTNTKAKLKELQTVVDQSVLNSAKSKLTTVTKQVNNLINQLKVAQNIVAKSKS